MWNGSFIKTITKYQYINCTNCTNGTNFYNFIVVFCLSYMGSGYFSFYTNCILIMIFLTLSFSILILFTDNKWFESCSATLVFTPFEIPKHPTFAQCLISNVLEPPN